MRGWKFEEFKGDAEEQSPFEQLLDLFKELLMHASGDVQEVLKWMEELDRHYDLTDEDYSLSDFIDDLVEKGYLDRDKGGQLGQTPTAKLEIALRRKALDDVFDQLKKSKKGNHNTSFTGQGDEFTSEIRPFQFGDTLDNLALSESLKNAQINHGIDDFKITERDLQVHETYHQSRMSTVLMIDISHSMILYGEDRITPAKRVAMALSEMITTRYPNDTLDIIVFGNDAWKVKIEDLPYLEVGPYHTNTVAGLELAMSLLRKKRNPNKQIMMITDGKPSCIKKGNKYYKNSMGLDESIVRRTLSLAYKCRKREIPVTTFMIARDPYLVQFVDQFTQANQGKAFYSSTDELGKFVFVDYKRNKKRRG